MGTVMMQTNPIKRLPRVLQIQPNATGLDPESQWKKAKSQINRLKLCRRVEAMSTLIMENKLKNMPMAKTRLLP